MARLEGRTVRGIGRRKEDILVRDNLRKHSQLLNVGQIITSEMDLNALFEVIMDQTNQMMTTERSTVFLHDGDAGELWSLVATGMKRNEIRIPSDYGVAGWVFGSGMPVIINDAYSDPRFFSEVDRRSGFRTRNILCVPLVNREGRCTGALQALNKRDGDFTDEDKDLLTSVSHYVAIAFENSQLYKRVKDYSDELKETLIRIETLEKVRNQLTKFVPSSVARLVEKEPDRLTLDKVPMQVTILFIDIQGFSAITESYDQKLVNDMVEAHFSRYLECINRHRGEVNETSGDGLMVIFKEGAVEMHAQDAVDAALEIASQCLHLNQEHSYPWGPVELHLGINSGQAWVGSTKMRGLTGERWTYTASGMVTVLAARIGALSEKSRVYVGPETRECIGNDYDCEFIGSRSLKNVNEPVPICWVKGNKKWENDHDLKPAPDQGFSEP